MPIKINNENELLETAKELAHVLVNLRHWTKKWEETYGAEYKNAKKRWEKKADELIKKLELIKKMQQSEIKIEINNEDISEISK